MLTLTLSLMLCSSLAYAQALPDGDRWNEREVQEREDAFRAIDPVGLKKLKVAKSDSLAIQAAWKLTTDAMHRERVDRMESHDQRPLFNFLGYVEGRTHINLPVWFQKTVVSATATANVVPNVSPRKIMRPAMFNASENVVSIRNLSIKETDGRYVILMGANSIDLPSSMLQESSIGICGDIDCLITEKYAYISTGDACASYAHDVCCIDLESKSAVWKTKSIAGYYGAIGGHSEALHELQLDDGRLFVICASHVGFFIECFDGRTGKSQIQFSTAFSP